MNNEPINTEKEMPRKKMIRYREIKIAALCLGLMTLTFILAAIFTYNKVIDLGEGLNPVLFSLLGIFFGATTIYLCTSKEPK